ncbi:MAG TPA: putative sulfate exporter family transporter, partial [Chitinophagales bacterium]|nr:putative sulfate exporter family transporter [Chitinophagales bacterium]
MEQKTQSNKDYFLNLNDNARKVIFILAVVFCLSPIASPPIALLLGIVLAQLIGHPFLQYNSKTVRLLLQVSVVGLGFGMNVNTALKAGKEGFLFTVVSIFGTLILGYFLGKLFKINEKTSFLVSTGTAICGGSAIAAVSPVIKAEEKQISVALGIVFILNSVALLVFPMVGKQLQLSQADFGLWSAIAIHDTSSVVGAASVYGNEALQIATTV